MATEQPDLASAVASFCDEEIVPASFVARLATLAASGPSIPDETEAEDEPEHRKLAAGFVLHYVSLALTDHSLSPDEQTLIRQLKRHFSLEEGDLPRLQRHAVAMLLQNEMSVILRDATVDGAEQIHQVDLQKALDLGYDQFLELIEPSIKPIVESLLAQLRANPFPNPGLREAVFKRLQLLNVVIPIDPQTLEVEWSPPTGLDNSLQEGRTIPQAVRDAVWRRDQGRCTTCSSQARLEFDHIIPFAKGGSSTYRNVQLLCQDCNRAKSARIG